MDFNRKVFWVVLGVKLGESLRDDIEIGLGLGSRDSGLEVAKKEPKAIERGFPGFGVIGFLGYPHVGIAPAKAWWHDSNQSAGRPIQHKCRVDKTGIGVETVDPCLVAEDEDRRSGGLVVCRLHGAAEERGHPQEFEGARRDQAAAKTICTFTVGVEDVKSVVADGAVKHVVLRHVVQELRAAVAAAASRLVALGVMNCHRIEALRVRVWERLHEDVFDDAEDGGGGADAQGESNHGHDGEAGVLLEVSSCVEEVLPDRAHEGAS